MLEAQGQNASGWVYMFPGQGSQFIGMAKDFFDRNSGMREIFALANEISGKNLEKLCFRGPISKLSNTDNLQVALTAVNLGIYRYIESHGAPPAAAALGHSVGEYSALCLGGALALDDALRATSERGRLMQREARQNKGAMYAVKDLDGERLANLMQDLGAGADVILANDNSPKQQVVSGTKDAVAELVQALTSRNIECIKLPVNGAWHSPLMRGASKEFSEVLQSLAFEPPKVPVVCNLTAEFYRDADEMRANLVEHLTASVRWRESVGKLLSLGYRRFVEVGPRRVLSRLLAQLAESEGVSEPLVVYGIESLDDADRFLGKAA